MNRIKISLALLFTAIVSGGCATILNGSTQELSFNSAPSGAEVYINGQQVGVTPVSVKWERGNEPVTVEFRKEGYETHTAKLNTEMNMAFLGNLITGGVFGTTTDAATGAMFKYAPGQYQAVLSPVGESNAAAFQRKLELMQFVMLSYSEISLELEKGEGQYLDTLLSKLDIAGEDKASAIERLRAIRETSNNIPHFAETVIDEFAVS